MHRRVLAVRGLLCPIGAWVRDTFLANQLVRLRTEAVSGEEQRSRSPATRDHAAAQHLPIHSALLARAATWHAAVPCLETVYTGTGAVFLGKMMMIFLQESSQFFLKRTLHTSTCPSTGGWAVSRSLPGQRRLSAVLMQRVT